MEPVQELVHILGREAIVLERVLMRLKGLELLLVTNEHRFLSNASADLDEALDLLDTWEERRTSVSRTIAASFGVDQADITVSEIIGRLTEPNRGLLLAAQVRLRELLADVVNQAGLDRDLAGAGVARVRVALERLGSAPGARYGQDGIMPRGKAPLSFDQRF